MNRWIAADLEQNPGDYGRPKGLTGKMGNLGGVPGWTQTDPICLTLTWAMELVSITAWARKLQTQHRRILRSRPPILVTGMLKT